VKRCLGVLTVGLALSGPGCAPPATPPPSPTAPPPPTALRDRPIRASAAPATSDSDVIARVGTHVVTKDQLLAPMIEAHGLTYLLHIVQLELARQATVQQNLLVTPEDIKKERDITLNRMFKESDDALRARLKEATEKGDNDAIQKLNAELNVDRESLLDQYLAQQYAQSRQYVTRQEFGLVMETNAYLRKIAEASPQLKNALDDETLRKTYNATYGEKIVVRHIQCADIAGITEARRRLQAGENFGEVARALSTNKSTAPTGGTVPPFTINATNVPDAFKRIAFALKNGEVSDTVQSDGAYHIIKVESRIAPKLVKFEDVKESLRADLNDRILQAAVKKLRDKLAAQTVANLKIENPVLKAQFDRRLEEGKVRQAEMDEAMKRSRGEAATEVDVPDIAPTTTPATAPAPSNKPAGATTKARPATRPASKPAQ
jgi:parvulin-like peptidyl-prolyl isomerase